MRFSPKPSRPVALFALLLAVVGTACALHADQAGIFDWHKQLIGTPKHTYFGTSAKGRSTLFVATEKNVIASLSPKTGKAAWRQVLEPWEEILAFKEGSAGPLSFLGLFSVTGTEGADGVNLRLWDASNGFVQWERPTGLPTPVTTTKARFSAFFGDDNIVAVLNGNTFVKLNLEDGKPIWTKTQSGKAIYTHIVAVGDKLYAVGTKTAEEHSNVSILSLNPKTGEILSTYQPKHSTVVSANIFTVGADHIVWTAGSDTYVHRLGGKESDVHDAQKFLRAEERSEHGYVIARSLAIGSNGVNAMQLAGLEEHYIWDGTFVDGKANLKVMGARPPAGWIIYTVAELEGGLFVARIMGTAWEKDWTIELLETKTGNVVVKHTIIHDFNAAGHIVKAHLQIARNKATSNVNLRLFLVTSDGSTRMWKDDSVLWTSVEALAHATAAQFVDLPGKDLLSQVHDELGAVDEQPEESASKNPIARYIRRWKAHILKLVTSVNSIADLPARFLPSNSATNSSEIVLHRDAHGVRKLIVFATTTGKVVALESIQGRVVWERFYPGVKFEQIEVIRTSVMKHPPLVAAIGIIESQDHKTMVLRINALTGADHAFPYSPAANAMMYVKQVVKLPVEELEERTFPLALIDNDNQITLLPNNAATRKAFDEIKSKFHFYDTDGVGAAGFDGYVLTGEVSPGMYGSRPSWSLRLQEGEKIAALPVREFDEQIASLGRVLGNRSVLYKYLNPNLLAFATTKQNDTAQTLYIYLLDTVSGVIHYRGVHYGAGNVSPTLKSVYVLQSENWVVYGYWNEGPSAVEEIPEQAEEVVVGKSGKVKKRKRRVAGKAQAPDAKGWEVGVLEVYESEKADEKLEGYVFAYSEGS
ncbi:hypothetical protein HK097_010648 [Rhizophlyctis rosea]|uniref:EMC1 first beta-propeller domain-containing protein n=1 Tax=Rhizophlyctis rosea TaxID=64517 RepID=A0AAD5X321_9FUNG|nr:hypothetical protein HK097_010648 [Rhizophlyctis rosea]